MSQSEIGFKNTELIWPGVSTDDSVITLEDGTKKEVKRILTAGNGTFYSPVIHLPNASGDITVAAKVDNVSGNMNIQVQVGKLACPEGGWVFHDIIAATTSNATGYVNISAEDVGKVVSPEYIIKYIETGAQTNRLSVTFNYFRP